MLNFGVGRKGRRGVFAARRAAVQPDGMIVEPVLSFAKGIRPA